jgi:hypothetical protein
MKQKLTKTAALLFAFLNLSSSKRKRQKNPFKVNLSEDGKKYIKFGANFQLWGKVYRIKSK